MPDPLKKTLSATQIPALFDKSPYVTRWLLWQHYRNGAELEFEPNERMEWGTRLEPAIFQATCERLNLAGEHHTSQTYFRHRALPIGCTPDGTIHDLNRGPGAVECKNVDWLQWKDNWTDTAAPDHIELQIQTQMLVRDQRWGIIACLVGGNELRLYHREPDPDLHERIITEADEFLASVREGREPDPMGRDIELPLWRGRIDLEAEPEPLVLMDSREASETIGQYKFWTARETDAKKQRGIYRNKLEFMARDATRVRAHGYEAFIKRSQVRASEVQLPDEIKEMLRGAINSNPATIKSAIERAIDWRMITRRAGVMVKIEEDRPNDGEADFRDDIFGAVTEPN